MRRYNSQDARRRVLAVCARLFLEKGYTNTSMADILREADVSASSFQNIFHAKGGVLTEFVKIMFSGQFNTARQLMADAPTPAHVYAVETALQLALTELNENLRDIYLEAYTCPETLALIHRRTAGELQAVFGAYLPACSYSLPSASTSRGVRHSSYPPSWLCSLRVSAGGHCATHPNRAVCLP